MTVLIVFGKATAVCMVAALPIHAITSLGKSQMQSALRFPSPAIPSIAITRY